MASRTERHRADPVKSKGVHYTPPPLAAFVAEQAVSALAPAPTVRVLDPACGDGALLAAVAHALDRMARVELCGFDLDPRALHDARVRLGSLSPTRSVLLDEVDFIEMMLGENRSAAPGCRSSDAMPLRNAFDLVIANPPYVRTQVLGADASRRLASAFGLTGRVDLYHAFAVAMAAALRSDGVLALLCSNRFLTTRAGHALRDRLSRTFEIVSIFDLGDTRAFGAAVLPAIVIARRNDAGTDRAPMVAIYQNRAATASEREAPSIYDALVAGRCGSVSVDGTVYELRRGAVHMADPGAPWMPRAAADEWVAAVDAAAVLRFGDVAKVRVGVKTTADEVFIRDRWDDLPHVPEAALVRPLITHHVARRWTFASPTKQILYPYDLTASSRVALDLRQWPKTAAYLAQHRDRLARRSYVVEAGREWWEIWVAQRPSAWAAPKIVCPDISEEPKFAYDRSGAVVNGDCYWMTVDDERLALLMIAVANSQLGRAYYDAVCGNRLYGGRRRYITQYVERFPIPDPLHASVGPIVEIERELMNEVTARRRYELEADIDVLVCESFGLTSDQIERRRR